MAIQLDIWIKFDQLVMIVEKDLEYFKAITINYQFY